MGYRSSAALALESALGVGVGRLILYVGGVHSPGSQLAIAVVAG